MERLLPGSTVDLEPSSAPTAGLGARLKQPEPGPGASSVERSIHRRPARIQFRPVSVPGWRTTQRYRLRVWPRNTQHSPPDTAAGPALQIEGSPGEGARLAARALLPNRAPRHACGSISRDPTRPRAPTSGSKPTGTDAHPFAFRAFRHPRLLRSYEPHRSPAKKQVRSRPRPFGPSTRGVQPLAVSAFRRRRRARQALRFLDRRLQPAHNRTSPANSPPPGALPRGPGRLSHGGRPRATRWGTRLHGPRRPQKSYPHR